MVREQNVWTSIKVLSPGCVPKLVGELLKNDTYALPTEVLIVWGSGGRPWYFKSSQVILIWSQGSETLN